jgi:hypothetical protein
MKVSRTVCVVMWGTLCVAMASPDIIGQTQEKHSSVVEIPTTAAGNLLSQWLHSGMLGD